MTMRIHYLFLFIFGLFMLATALFFQLVIGLEPCPLCVLQRIATMATGLLALLAFLHDPEGVIGRRIYTFLLLAGASTSLFIAARHTWLLHLPKDETAGCGPGLEVWIDRFISYLPQGHLTETLFRSGAECTEVTWSLFGLSIPELTLPVFLALTIYTCWLFLKQR